MKKKTSLKQMFLNIPLLIKIKRIVARYLNLPSAALSPADKDYFPNIFANHRNVKSLSFDKGIVEGNFRNTSFLLSIRPQNLIESHVFINGVWEPHISELIGGFLNVPNAAVIDVGANVGATSIPLAKHFTEARFFLFEPHPIIFNDLVRNISFNKIENIKAYNIAITDQSDSFLPFFAQKNAKNFGLSSFTLNHDIEEYEVIRVECKSLDAMFDSEINLKVIKIDTQGHELNVLLSAKNLILKYRPIVFFEFESEYFQNLNTEVETKENLLAFFQQLNYEIYMIGGESKFFPKVTLENYFNGDILALPSSS